MFIIAVASLFISLLSPFLGYIFVVSIGGSNILNRERQRVAFYIIICLGIIVLFLLRAITILEIFDILVSVVLVSWLFIITLMRTEDYTKALYFGCLSQTVYGMFRYFAFGGIYQERVEMLFRGYESMIGNSIATLGSDNAQMEAILLQIKSIMIDYRMAIWGISMIFAVYIAALFYAKRASVKWQHHLLNFPHSLIYIFIITLILAILPQTRLLGQNGVLIVVTILLLQGLAIIDFWSKKHFKNSRFIMLAAIVLMFVNVFFALLVSLLGLIDNWLDIRKINHI